MRRPGSERFGELLFYGVLILVGYLAYLVTAPFLASLAWAAIFALTLSPLHRRLSAPIGNTRAALVTTLAAAVLIVGPLATLISMLAGEVPQLVEFAQTLPAQATPERVQTIWDNLRHRDPGLAAR